MQTTDIKEDPPNPDGEETPWYSNTLVWVLIFSVLILAMRLAPDGPLGDLVAPILWFFETITWPFRWLTAKALDVTKYLFQHYGYLTVFGAPLCENTILLGALIPGTVVMLLGGLSASDGLIRLWLAIPLGIVGAWIGDTISYSIGRFGWRRLGPDSRFVKAAEGLREPLLENSGWLIILYHFAGYSRLIGPAASGFLRVPFARWIVLDYIGSALWVIAFMTGGYLLGEFTDLTLDSTEKNVRIVENLLFALAIVSVSLLLYRARTKKEADLDV